ncbi:MAG: hypothetical protein R6V07_07380 [Armatimonadota bacterium]
MAGDQPVALWRHSLRLFVWLFVVLYGIGAIGFLVAVIAGILPERARLLLYAPFVIAGCLLPLVAAFYFGRWLQRDHGLDPAAAAAVGIGGGGLLVLLILGNEAYELWWEEDADFRMFAFRAAAYIVLILIVAGLTTLGTWWEARTAHGNGSAAP